MVIAAVFAELRGDANAPSVFIVAYRPHNGFIQPTGMAVDGSDNVFVADYGNDAVKEILGGRLHHRQHPGQRLLTTRGRSVEGNQCSSNRSEPFLRIPVPTAQ
jgi:hypothetical protein